MAYHPYQIQANGAFVDPNMFPIPVPGMPPPFLPMPAQVGMSTYPAAIPNFGTLPRPTSDMASHNPFLDGLNRGNSANSRNSRGRRGRNTAEHGTRLALFLEYPKKTFRFVEDDLVELFSHFGGVSSVSIKTNIAAAEVTLLRATEARIAIDELNNIEIEGVGRLRCVEIKRDDSLDYMLSKLRVYEKQREKLGGNRRAGDDVKVNRAEGSDRPAARRLARFELVDVFTYEPEFDVAMHIIGKENANVEYIIRNANGKVDITITGKPLNTAPVAERLHVSLSSDDLNAYKNALGMLEELLTTVCENFVEYAKSRGQVPPATVGFTRHEYRGAEDNLKYLGATEHPKTWLSLSTAPPFRSKHHNNRAANKKVGDRSRGINRGNGNAQQKANNRANK